MTNPTGTASKDVPSLLMRQTLLDSPELVKSAERPVIRPLAGEHVGTIIHAD